METSKELKRLPRLLIAYQKLTVRPYCLRQHLDLSLNMEQLCWCLARAFTMSEYVVLLQLGSLLISITHVATKATGMSIV